MLVRTFSKEEKMHCLKSLKTLFDLDSFDNYDFSISAVQKGCLVSFFEARDIIAFGLSEGMIKSVNGSENSALNEKFRLTLNANQRFF